MTATQIWKQQFRDVPKKERPPFKEWIEEQKLQGHFIVDQDLNSQVWNAVGEEKPGPKIPKSFYGIDTRILMVSAGLVIAAVILKHTILKK